MAVNEILEDIEDLLANGTHIPIVNRITVDEEILTSLLDGLRNELPRELQRAEQIIHNKDNTIAQANKEASDIIERAKEYASQLVDENDIVQQANEKARQIIDEANAQAQEIMTQANSEAQELKNNSYEYATEVFDSLIANINETADNLQNALNVLHQAKDGLTQMALEDGLDISMRQ